MADVQGFCDPRFDHVRALLQHYVANDEECGAAVTVNLAGENLVDIWAGHKDESKTIPWQQDTIVNVFSTTKNIVALAGLMLIDRGLINPTTKVSEVWPEFSAHGKENIEFRMLLSHTSGLAGWEEQVQVEDVYDLVKTTGFLAEQKPWWEPGTASGYHAWTYGHLVGEVVRRVTGRSLTEFVNDEIARPLKADFQIGCRESDWPRIADLIDTEIPNTPAPSAASDQSVQKSLTVKTVYNPVIRGRVANTPAWRRAEIGGSNGHASARGVVKAMSVIPLGGEVDGVRLLKPETIDLIFQEQAFGNDFIVPAPMRFGIGYGLAGKDTIFDWLPDGKTCVWGGWGGSIVVMDVERRLTIAYVMNKMTNDGFGNYRSRAYIKAVYDALGVPN